MPKGFRFNQYQPARLKRGCHAESDQAGLALGLPADGGE
jgi:hypothetical protein